MRFFSFVNKCVLLNPVPHTRLHAFTLKCFALCSMWQHGRYGGAGRHPVDVQCELSTGAGHACADCRQLRRLVFSQVRLHICVGSACRRQNELPDSLSNQVLRVSQFDTQFGSSSLRCPRMPLPYAMCPAGVSCPPCLGGSEPSTSSCPPSVNAVITNDSGLLTLGADYYADEMNWSPAPSAQPPTNRTTVCWPSSSVRRRRCMNTVCFCGAGAFRCGGGGSYWRFNVPHASNQVVRFRVTEIDTESCCDMSATLSQGWIPLQSSCFS